MQLKIPWVWFAGKYISNYCLILNAADTRNKIYSKNYFWCFELSVFRIKPKLQISFPVNYSKNLSDVTYVLKNQSYVQNGGSLTLLCRFTANQAKIEKKSYLFNFARKFFFRIPNLQPQPSWTVLMSFASGYFFSVPYLIIYFHI